MGAANLDQTIEHNVRVVRERVERAAERSRRDPGSVRLVAVSKTFSVTHIRAAARAGISEFGENRVQEALQKIADGPDLARLVWHLVGHLQSNKARRVVGPFGWIHSVDSLALVERLERASADNGPGPRLLVQVDLAKEPTKHGASVDEARRIVDSAADRRHVQLVGLMVLPPWSDDPEQARPYFQRLRQLRDQWLSEGVDPAHLAELSMGMSHDFEVGIEEGATIVRVGTAIFGPRSRPHPASPSSGAPPAAP